jgi:RNA-directed DNA polymerase
MRVGSRDTSSILRNGAKVTTKLLSITQRARESLKERFTSLMHLLTEDFLVESFKELERDKAPGVDGVTVKEYGANLEENLKDLVARLKSWRYKPQPVRRVYIPKSGGKKRPLGIPAVEDKIVQMAIKRILEAIFEVDFIDVSFGFRPKRSCHDALVAVDRVVMTKPVNYVVDMDIEKFFDTVDHKWLMRCLRQRVVDSNLLRLIGRFLKVGVMEEGEYYQVDRGTPQGGIISPLLANIYLHYVLDLWFEKVIRREVRGFTQLIRYADDCVVCFQSGKEAEAFGEKFRERLSKFGLRIAEGKSRIIEFGRYPWLRARREGRRLATFDFLGFTHYCGKTRKGKFKLGQKTSKAKFKQKVKGINQWLKNVRNLVELKEWWVVLRKKLTGHYRYYGISGNMTEMWAFYEQICSIAYKWTNRRSERRSYNWQQFQRYLKYNPLPQPKIYHLTYILSSV